MTFYRQAIRGTLVPRCWILALFEELGYIGLAGRHGIDESREGIGVRLSAQSGRNGEVDRKNSKQTECHQVQSTCLFGSLCSRSVPGREFCSSSIRRRAGRTQWPAISLALAPKTRPLFPDRRDVSKPRRGRTAFHPWGARPRTRRSGLRAPLPNRRRQVRSADGPARERGRRSRPSPYGRASKVQYPFACLHYGRRQRTERRCRCRAKPLLRRASARALESPRRPSTLAPARLGCR
jgi:hypothetical protein